MPAKVTGCQIAQGYQWIAAGCAITALALLLAPGCNKADDQQSAQVYAANHCAVCHGDALEGKPNLGPALRNLGVTVDSSNSVDGIHTMGLPLDKTIV